MDDEQAYVSRLKNGPSGVSPGTLVEVTEEYLDCEVGARAVIVKELDGWEWPVYEVEWLEPEDQGDSQLAGAFFEIVLEPTTFKSVTDVEKFLGEA